MNVHASTFQYHHVVTLDETNIVGNVYFAHYLHWQGHCRELFLNERAPDVMKALVAGDLAMMTVTCSMEYYAESYAFDSIIVEMSLRATTGNRISMDYKYRRDDQLIARGCQTVACMRRVDDHVKPTAIPAELASAMEQFS